MRYIGRIATGLALLAAGCIPIKGDTSIFSGDKSRTLEARAKVGDQGPGVFVRERLTTPDYADQSKISHFSLADLTYTKGNFTALAGTRSTAKFDIDRLATDESTGHIDPRFGGWYAKKTGDWRFFVNPTVFTNLYEGESHHPQFELNATIGYQPEISEKLMLDLEAENIFQFSRTKWRQATQRLRGGVSYNSYKGFRAGIGTDMIETDVQAKPAFNTGLYVGFRF